MKNKSVLAIFVVALATVVSGVVYFGGALNQQASVGNLVKNKAEKPTAMPLPSVDESKKLVSAPVMSDTQWARLCTDGKPHIQVTYPNGNEIFIVNDSIRPEWRSCNISTLNAKAEIIEAANPFKKYLLGTGEPGFGSMINHSPSIEQSTLLGTKNFKVKVTQEGVVGVSDVSNATFIINPPPSDFGVTLGSSSGIINVNNNGTVDEAIFKITFNITNNVGSDVYIDKSCRSGSVNVTDALNFVIEDKNGLTSVAITTCDFSAQNAVEFPKGYRINGQSTETFTLTVAAKPTTPGIYHMRISGIGYNTTSGDIEGNKLITNINNILTGLKTQYITIN